MRGDHMIWKKILFVFNPVAGRSQIRNSLLDIIEILSKAEYKVTCYPTTGRGDARRVVRERKDDYLYIVCAGGDGTLDEVVSGMMENRDKPFVPIGYIPAGTTNDFASSLHIPTDMLKAAEVIAQGRTFWCDLGCFNEKDYFTYVAAFGLFTGTSFACPFVTGSAALLMEWGIQKGNDPFLFGEKVKAYLQKSARPIAAEREYPNPRLGYGTLCILSAILLS